MNEHLETADEYGRSEGCFVDHKGRPFRFQDCTEWLQETKEPVDAGGLVSVSGLQPGVLPNPKIDVHSFDRIDAEDEFLVSLNLDQSYECRSPNLPHGANRFRWDGNARVEVVHLDSDPDVDIQDYLSVVAKKTHPNIFNRWLPYCSVRDDQDEGLGFPPYSSRFRPLLLRELEIERVTTPEEALDLLKTIGNDSGIETCFDLPRNCENLNQTGHISPPLLPISEPGSPFVPDEKAAIIDLTSELGSSPKSYRQRWEDILPVPCDSDTAVEFHDIDVVSPSFDNQNKKTLPIPCIQDLKLDVPIVPSNPMLDDLVESPLADRQQFAEMLGNIDDFDPFNERGQFDEEISNLIESNHCHTTQMVEQEQYGGLDTLPRLAVPLMEFRIAPPAWIAHTSSAKALFNWIIAKGPHPLRYQDTVVDEQTSLSASEFEVPSSAVEACQRLLDDEAELNQQNLPNSSEVDTVEPLESQHRPKSTLPLILQLGKELDVEILPLSPVPDKMALARLPKTMCEKSPLLNIYPESISSQKLHAGTAETTPQLGTTYEKPPSVNMNQGPIFLRKLDAGKAQQGMPLLNDEGAISKPLFQRIETSEPLGALPLSNDGDATAKLLSSFMELRAVKTRRLDDGTPKTMQVVWDANKQPQLSPQTLNSISEAEKVEVLKPAYSPPLHIPKDKGYVIISHNLPRPILRHLESVWPPNHILDRNYTAAGNFGPSALAHNPALKTSFAAEADLSLTPTVGVIITSLIKVRQKPLPGSTSLQELRERILRVSLKYETLVILVSECNALGDYEGVLVAADTTAYSDFVRFVKGIHSGVVVRFIHGACKTAAEWCIDLMCQHSPVAAGLKHYLSEMESAWEVFLRQAGLNVFAAQVLAGVLFEEMGDAGLTQFESMTAQERVSRYGYILGGSKALLNIKPVVGPGWE